MWENTEGAMSNCHVVYSARAKTISSLYLVDKCSACVYLRKADLITIKNMRDRENAQKFTLPIGHQKPDMLVVIIVSDWLLVNVKWAICQLKQVTFEG
jgi:hypothetical protein